MASLVYNGLLSALAQGTIDLDTDTINVLLTTSSYSESKDAHVYRSSVTNEVTGTGYTAGGNTVVVTLSPDGVNNRLDIILGGTTWPASTITARKAVYYVSRGGASSADELIAVIDFGADKVTTAGTLTLTSSTVRVSN